MKKKAIICILILFLIIIITGIFIFIKYQGNKQENGTQNTNEIKTQQIQETDKQRTEKSSKKETTTTSENKIDKEKEYNGIKITNVHLTKQDKGNSVALLADIENTTKEEKKKK